MMYAIFKVTSKQDIRYSSLTSFLSTLSLQHINEETSFSYCSDELFLCPTQCVMTYRMVPVRTLIAGVRFVTVSGVCWWTAMHNVKLP